MKTFKCLVIFVFILVRLVQVIGTTDTHKMVMIYGEPFKFSSDFQTEFFPDFKACVDYCYNMTKCVAVHQDGQVPGCEIFEIGKIQEIKTLDVYAGKLAAVKMLSNNSCSASSDGNSMFGRIQTNNTYQNYTITVIDDIWQFSTSPFYSCPDGFMLVFRTLGMWCMGVLFKQNSAGITQVEATSICANDYNAILSGFDSTEEKLWVVSIASPLVNSSPYPTHGYWVNGVRKSTCMWANQIGPDCDKSKAFDITDPTMTLYNAYVWGYDNQPNGMTDNNGASNCIVFRVNSASGNGMDDRPCNSLTEPEKVFYNGFICGLRPNES